MSRKLRIVLALGLVVAGMGVVALETRRASRAHLRDTLAAHVEAGMGSDLDDLVAMAPVVDVARQERTFAWMQIRKGEPASYSMPLAEDWFLDGEATPPEEDLAWADTLRPRMETLRTLLREGPLCLGVFGWLRQDLERIRSTPTGQRQPRLPHLVRLREAHRWLAFEAMVDDDPRPALEDLDRLAGALDTPGSLIDAMIVGACAPMRDRVYVRLALRDKLTTPRLRRWLEAPARGHLWVADAWRGERLLYWAPLGQQVLGGARTEDHFAGTQKGLPDWLHGASHVATLLECLAATEAHMRGDVSLDSLRASEAPAETLDGPYAQVLANRPSMNAMGVVWRAQHRLARLGVRLARMVRAHGEAPADHDEARRWLGEHAEGLDARAWDVALRYEPLGGKRFRLAIDPDAPLPNVLEDGSTYTQILQSHLGQPASTRRLVLRQGTFEYGIE